MQTIYRNLKQYTIILTIQIIELVLVVISLTLSFVIAGLLIYGDLSPFGIINGMLLSSLTSAVAVIILASHKYFNFLDISFIGIMGKSFWTVFAINFILIIILYFASAVRMSPYFFIVAATIQIASLLMIKIITGRLKRNTLSKKISLIIGENAEKNTLVRSLGKRSDSKLTFVDKDEANLYACIDKSDNIYLMTSAPLELKNAVIAYCERKNKRLFIIPEIHEIAMRDSEMTQIVDIPLFTIEGFRLTEAQIIVKRIVDIILSSIGIILTSPILLIFAILIKLEDGGPVFFKQERSGINGKTFNIIKLRSMVIDAEKYTGAVCALENDPRITKVGRFIRTTRIDEIPQFYNVFGGSMSITGPRPERPVFVEKFSEEWPEYIHRMAVKPGITGLAQVMGKYTTTAENKLKFDLVYIKKYSPLFDLSILVKTIKVMFLKEQAEGYSTKRADIGECSEDDADVNISNKRGGRNGRRTYNLIKSTLIVFCCIITIGSSVFMRYSSLMFALIEADSQSAAIQTELINKTIHPKYDNKQPETYIKYVPDKIVLLKEEFDATLGSMTFQDRVEMVYELITKLDMDDLIALEELSEDGFSEEEIAIAKNIMAKNFDEDERSKLKILFANF